MTIITAFEKKRDHLEARLSEALRPVGDPTAPEYFNCFTAASAAALDYQRFLRRIIMIRESFHYHDYADQVLEVVRRESTAAYLAGLGWPDQHFEEQQRLIGQSLSRNEQLCARMLCDYLQLDYEELTVQFISQESTNFDPLNLIAVPKEKWAPSRLSACFNDLLSAVNDPLIRNTFDYIKERRRLS